jgi:hypothetical protein
MKKLKIFSLFFVGYFIMQNSVLAQYDEDNCKKYFKICVEELVNVDFKYEDPNSKISCHDVRENCSDYKCSFVEETNFSEIVKVEAKNLEEIRKVLEVKYGCNEE